MLHSSKCIQAYIIIVTMTKYVYNWKFQASFMLSKQFCIFVFALSVSFLNRLNSDHIYDTLTDVYCFYLISSRLLMIHVEWKCKLQKWSARQDLQICLWTEIMSWCLIGGIALWWFIHRIKCFTQYFLNYNR